VRLAAAAIAIMAALSPLTAAAAGRALTPQDVLGSFAGVDATKTFLPASNGAVSQAVSDRMFAALQKVLGGSAPRLKFAPVTDPGGEFNAYANPADNTVTLDPTAMEGLVDPRSQSHDGSVVGLPHEFMHLRQTPGVLADTTQREGGAQAFADLVAAAAAKIARIPYTGVPGAFDGSYAPLVQAVTQKYGRDWILGGQMGKPPVAWP
jgi:hypothetical protein